jgi:hypothetical protein
MQNAKYFVNPVKAEKLRKLRADSEADAQRFESSDRPDDDLLGVAFGYMRGYPTLRQMIGPDDSQERYCAHHALVAAHVSATHLLMREAERVNIDSGPLWEFSRLCREMVANCHQNGLHANTWPECLGPLRDQLPARAAEAIRSGEAALMRLDARLGVEPTSELSLDDKIVRMLPRVGSDQGLMAKEIRKKLLPRRMAESTLRKHHLSPLKKSGKIKNIPRIGYQRAD